MRILFSSNSLHAPTGYGVQTRGLINQLVANGHEVALFAWYGVEGAPLNAGKVKIYPKGPAAYGTDMIGHHAKHFKADIAITLQDIWVLPPRFEDVIGVPWVAWFPVDHDPVPPVVLARARDASYPVTYSQFGHDTCADKGLETDMIPHGIDRSVFRPDDKSIARKKVGFPEDRYIVSIVAANKDVPSRKALNENVMAFKLFHDKYPDALLYLHTAMQSQTGVDLISLLEEKDLLNCVVAADQYLYMSGQYSDGYMASVYQGSDLVLAAAMGEGFGIPILEAQSCGCPVVTTDWTAMPEITWNGIATKPLQLFRTPLDSWQALVSIENVFDAMCKIRERSPEEARKGFVESQMMADRYDWDFVYKTYWAPFLERVESEQGSGLSMTRF
jgi:glycosyltransferase involved in cell wall biosynthesis